jgi:hypothetical protein
MNEYIKELLLKVVPMEGEDGDLFPSLYTKKQIEEFAGLIVRECVRYFNEDYQRDFDTMWREDLSKGIKKHFGVE